MNAKQIWEQCEQLYSKRSTLMMQWQDIALNFYPARADFTFQRSLGMELVSDLMSSWPLLCQRRLADAIGQMLRPTAKAWFESGLANGKKLDVEGKQWLQKADCAMRAAMYAPAAWFTDATKAGDNDFATFGQTVIHVGMTRRRDNLLYRCYHLRDCVWMEDEDRQFCLVGRKWKPNARTLVNTFGSNVHADVAKLMNGAQPSPFAEIDCVHMVVHQDMYNGTFTGPQNKACPFVSIFYDQAHDQVMEAITVWNRGYIIPRWQTPGSSQYAFSPATVIGLPEARLLQSMTYTLLEAGEKATNPPLIATGDVVRGDVATYAGGITVVDREYDERLGDALRPITQDLRGLPLGEKMQMDSREILTQVFYLDTLKGPQQGGPQMTAFEVGQLVQQYIRDALPLFEPMEMGYNGAIYHETFDICQRNGLFGSPFDRPRSLMGQSTEPTFRSPLHDAINQAQVQVFQGSMALVAQAVQADPSMAGIIDYGIALPDALEGNSTPETWIRSKTEMLAIQKKQQQAQSSANTLAEMQSAANVAKTVSDARSSGQMDQTRMTGQTATPAAPQAVPA